ncbi:MAG: hypothetical protein R3C53_28280 [Pirellulaceae bacterium]
MRTPVTLIATIFLLIAPAILRGQDFVQVVEVVEEEVQDLEALFDEAPIAGVAEQPQMAILQQYVIVECGLVRRACELSPEQAQKLATLTPAWIKEQLAQPAAAGQNGLFQGIGRFLGGRAPAAQPQADGQANIRRVTKAVDKFIEAALTPDQAKTYLAEKDAREKFRQEATASVLVASIDQEIYVKAEQRQQLIPQIAKWVENKNLYWQFYFQNQSYIPSIPDSILQELGRQTSAIAQRPQRIQLRNGPCQSALAVGRNGRKSILR